MSNEQSDVQLTLEPQKIVESFLIKGFGLVQYDFLINNYRSANLSMDTIFQRKFNAFYIVRRNSDWRDTYYRYFEENKSNSKLTFSEILLYLFDKTGNIEPSFSSKMLSTIDTNMPIWDQYVLESLDLRVEGKTKIERLKNTISTYERIIEWYRQIVRSKEGKDLIEYFDKILPSFKHISEIKKIDCFLWQNRE